MKKAKDFGKKNEGKEYQKPSIRLVSNVGTVRENEDAQNYKAHLKLSASITKILDSNIMFLDGYYLSLDLF